MGLEAVARAWGCLETEEAAGQPLMEQVWSALMGLAAQAQWAPQALEVMAMAVAVGGSASLPMVPLAAAVMVMATAARSARQGLGVQARVAAEEVGMAELEGMGWAAAGHWVGSDRVRVMAAGRAEWETGTAGHQAA